MNALQEKILARRVQVAVMRAAFADRMYPKLRAAIRAELEREVHEFARLGKAKAPDSLIRKWAKRIDSAIRSMITSMAAHGWELAGQEIKHVERSLGKSDSNSFKGKSLVVHDRDNFLTKADFSKIDQWISSTKESASNTSAKTLSKIFTDAAEDGLTPLEISKKILEAGVTRSDTRSKMLAHTGSIWSYNEGATQRYKDAGVTVIEWLTADDDLACPFCAEMNGKRIETGDAFFKSGDKFSFEDQVLEIPSGARGFDVRHPPLHPNCRCTVVPIFEENS